MLHRNDGSFHLHSPSYGYILKQESLTRHPSLTLHIVNPKFTPLRKSSLGSCPRYLIPVHAELQHLLGARIIARSLAELWVSWTKFPPTSKLQFAFCSADDNWLMDMAASYGYKGSCVEDTSINLRQVEKEVLGRAKDHFCASHTIPFSGSSIRIFRNVLHRASVILDVTSLRRRVLHAQSFLSNFACHSSARCSRCIFLFCRYLGRVPF